MGQLSPPALLADTHITSNFHSGQATLDEWLIKRARKNQRSGASKAFVICDQGQEVVGYYALATGSVERKVAPANFARSMPEPIPVIVLGRLAVDQRYQGQGLGAALLRDAMLRVIMLSEHVGIRGLLVHAINHEAKRFYLRYGFVESPMEPMTLLISLKTLQIHLAL